MKLFSILAMACLAASALGQTTTMVSSHLEGDLTGTPFTGRICVTPMLADRATAFSADGAAQVMPVRTCYPINAGVVNAVVPNTSLANPPIGLSTVIQDTNGFNVYQYPGLLFTSAEPLDLDEYAPTQTVKVTTPTFNFFTSIPTGDCGSTAAEGYLGSVTNISVYFCIAHHWVLQTGSGGGVQADWNATSGPSEILNKPTLAAVATSGSYADLSNKPSIPPVQVNSDWNASSGLAQILNKPSLGSASSHAVTDFDGAGSATAAQSAAKSYSDSLATNYDPAGAASSAIAGLPAAARSGSYTDLTNKPALGTAATHAATDFDAAGSASSAQAAATTAAEAYTDAHAVAPSTGITPGTGGNLTSSTSGALLNLQKIGALYIVGDSFTRGIGVNSYAQSFAALLAKDTPAPVYNVAVGSTVTSQYMLQALNNFDPNPNFTTVTLLSGIENDGLGGGTGAPLIHYNLTESALLGWLTIPMANRTWVSTCTKTGSVFPYSGASSIYVPTFTWQAPLPALTAAMEPTSAGAIETCTITTPTSVNKIGINYGVVTGSTTTFTATIDGISVTDACSGTTTFSNGPCNAFQNGQTVGLYRQEYSVTPGTSHTVVLTYGSGGTGNQALWQSIDWAVPNSASNNVVFQLATNPAWANFATNNTAEQAMINQFRADGLSVNYVDTVNGVTVNGQTYAVNGTTDVATTATATCSASNNAKHPNTCGEEHIREAIQASEYSAIGPTGSTGFVFSSPNLVANQALNDNAISNGPFMTKEWPSGLTAAASMVLTNGNAFGSTHITGSTTITSLTPWPLCQGDEYTNCMVSFVFDTVGGGVGTGGNPYPFKQAFTAATAGTAATFMWDSTSQAWFLVGSGNAYDAAGAAAATTVYSNSGLVLPTSAIAANTCTAATGSPFTATGVTTSMEASFGWASDPSGVTGYGSTGGLSVRVFPGSGIVAVKVCNPNSTSITPGAVSINVRVHP